MRDRITIKDIAKLIGVNPSTVSRALKNHPDISTEMCQKVQSVAKELGYRPNVQAINFRKRESRLVALILPDMNMFFFPSVIQAVEEEVRKQNYQLIIFQSGESEEQEIQNIEICKNMGVDAILISVTRETTSDRHLQELAAEDIPVVFFDKTVLNSNLPKVVINDNLAAKKAVQYIIEKGRRNIAALLQHNNLDISQLRYKGYKEAIQNEGLTINTDAVFFTQNKEEARHVFRSFLKNHHETDAVFTMTDELTGVAIDVIHELKWRIPEDIALVGISDGQLPYLLHPKLTHILHSGYDVGKAAVALLFEVMRTRVSSKTVYVDTHLVRLDSV